MMKLYNGPIHDIDLDAPPDTRWIQFASSQAGAIHKLLADVETCVDEELSSRLCAPLRAVLMAALSGGGSLLRYVVNWFGEEYTQELACIAKHADVPVGKLMLGNLIYDFTSLSEMYGCGCSSVSFEVNESPLLVRNMDWVMPRSTGRHTKVMRFHRGGKAYTAVGVAGMVGVVSAMSDDWAVTVNQAPVVEKLNTMAGFLSAPKLLCKWPALQRVRVVCDQLPSYNGMVLGLRSHDTIVPFFAHVVGTKTREHTVVTHVGNDSAIRTRRHSIVQTNHYVAGEYKAYNMPEITDDGYQWSTFERYRKVTQRLKTALDEKEFTQEVAKQPVRALRLLASATDEDTMQQMVLWPARKQMVLKTRLNG
jgi:hypothetical protein